ncbi:MAG: BPL-N domain-containing protein [Candidatus Nanopelagicales bacterium]
MLKVHRQLASITRGESEACMRTAIAALSATAVFAFPALLIATPIAGTSPTSAATVARGDAGRPLALVYRGPAGCKGCSEAAAKMLKTSRYKFQIRYIGPNEALKLTPSSFAGAAMYVQPGGDTSVAMADRLLGADAQQVIKDYVASGGHYLGICQGAYLAGTDPGMGMLSPGNTGQYIATKGASTKSVADTVIPIKWGKRTISMYFQDGAYIIPSKVRGEKILARYTNGKVAALTKPYGAGRIGVIGPHPEAPAKWYRLAGLKNKDRDGLDARYGHKLINSIMK